MDVLGNQAVRGLLKRLLPDHADQFELETIGQEQGKDVFEIESLGNQIVLRGSNGVSLASALHWYLKYVCHCHISWSGNQLSLPNQLSTVPGKIRKVTSYQFRYIYNFCTFNYSMTWWDWERWEREIDWMALHGINMPLAMTGQEAVWMAVGKRLGLTDEQMLDHLTGPGYLAWHYMGNVDGIAGPLPQSWIEGQKLLQQRIIEREREYGMTPVLCGFYGHVPKSLKEINPEANITQLKSWFGMPGIYFLDPSDPLFAEAAGFFYDEQRRLYGTDHLYAMDLFHEGSSPDATESYLMQTAATVSNTMLQNDPQAVWVMQSWTLSEPMVKALPDEHLLILDLYAEVKPVWKRTEAFYGKPWIWCMLHNFGGRNGMFGNLESIANGPVDALHDPGKGRMAGIGFAPEAIEENPVMYDLLGEMIWRTESIEVEVWLKGYTLRRYGQSHDQAEAAWELLRQSVYSGLNVHGSVESVIHARPALSITRVCNGSVVPFYDIHTVVKAWELLVAASDRLADSVTFQYDLIDVGREVLAGLAHPIYLQMIKSFQASDQAAFHHNRILFESLIADLDELVGTNPYFLTGRWMEAAKSWGNKADETALYEFNARSIISTWWPEPLTFDDYAHKMWSGMLKSYYLDRWKQFNNRLEESIVEPTAFNEVAFEQDIRAWEIAWMYRSNSFAIEPLGDSIEFSKRMLEKYGHQVNCYWGQNQLEEDIQ